MTGTDWTYNQTSLNFSDLSSNGGSITGLSTGSYAIGRRAFSTPLPSSSIYWGSFLTNISAQTGNFWTTSVFVGQSTDNDQQATFAMKSKDYAVTVGGVSVEGSTSSLTGTTISTGTTYLNLFKADPANKSITGWILTAAQYDNFKSGGITESELNGALTGSAANQVFNRGTLTTANTLDPATTLGILNYTNLNNGTSSYDRIYFSAIVLTPRFRLLLCQNPALGPCSVSERLVCLAGRDGSSKPAGPAVKSNYPRRSSQHERRFFLTPTPPPPATAKKHRSIPIT